MNWEQLKGKFQQVGNFKTDGCRGKGAVIEGQLIMGVALQIEPFLGPSPEFLFDNHKWGIAIEKLKELGIGYVRIVLDWRWIQWKNKESFQWNGVTYPYDNIIKDLTKNHIQILAIIMNSPPWANGGKKEGTHPPSKSKDYGDFVFAVVDRYKHQIKNWELWNEPNIVEFWGLSPNTSNYMKILAAGYKAAKTADPDSVIISAGLANAPNIKKWLQAMYDDSLSLRNYSDVIAIHPYSWYLASPDSQVNNSSKIGSYNVVEEIYQIMVANNDGKKKIWITEHGWQANEIGEGLQSRFLSNSINIAKRNWPFVGAYFWFEFIDKVGSFGLLRNDKLFSERKAYNNYKYIINRLTIWRLLIYSGKIAVRRMISTTKIIV